MPGTISDVIDMLDALESQGHIAPHWSLTTEKFADGQVKTRIVCFHRLAGELAIKRQDATPGAIETLYKKVAEDLDAYIREGKVS